MIKATLHSADNPVHASAVPAMSTNMIQFTLISSKQDR